MMFLSRLCLASGLIFASPARFGGQAAATRTAAVEAIIRLDGPIFNPQLHSQSKLLAFTSKEGQALRILDFSNHDVFEVSKHRVGPAFFWSPDGVRLFYRELINKDAAVASQLQVYDAKLNRSLVLESLPGSSGYLTFDPRELKVFLMHEKGVLSKKLEFPGERFGAWQKQKKPHEGQWLSTQAAILWLSDMGLSLKKLQDDGSGVQSFSISPDGQRIAWATEKGTIYTASAAHPEAILLEAGRDPSWHPSKTLLVYAAARKIGSKVYDYDLKLSDLNSPGRFLRSTPDLAERWPLWLDADQLIFTADGTTDLFKMSFTGPEPLAVSKSHEPGQLQ